MEELKFRTLRADEIECRVAQVGKTKNGAWCSLLLYKDARCDQRLLDEVVGCFRWQRTHELINGNLFCTVSIRDEQGNWVSKQDVGTESNTEKEKGQASDAFKRACFNWGLGRELYTSPKIFINLTDSEVKDENGKVKVSPRVSFKVTAIEYDERRNVSYLTIEDNTGVTRFTFGKSNPVKNPIYASIMDDVANCVSRAELETLWRDHKELHTNPDFVNAVTEKGKTFNKELK